MKPGSKKPTHCVHYLPNLDLEDGGVPRFVVDLCTVLAKQGMRVTLITQQATDAPEHWNKRDDVPAVIVVNQRQLPGGLLTAKSLAKIALIFEDDVVLHLHIPWLLSNFQLAKLAKAKGVPYVVTPHGSLDTWSMAQKRLKKKIFWFLFGKRHYKDAMCIHYTAQCEREQGEKYIVKNAVKVIPCLFDTAEFRDLPDESLARKKFKQISNDKPNILFLSRIHPKKGTDILVQAAKILNDKGIEFNMLLAGPDDSKAKGYREQLKSLITESELNNSVHLIGMVKGQEKLSLYKLCDLFVLPTHQENFGLVLVEAMACGTAILTSYGVDIWKEIKLGGATITNNEADKVAAEIERLLSNKKQLNNLGDDSRNWVLKEFDAEKLAADYSLMYIQSF